jgi:hypothetical protein
MTGCTSNVVGRHCRNRTKINAKTGLMKDPSGTVGRIMEGELEKNARLSGAGLCLCAPVHLKCKISFLQMEILRRDT